MLLCGIALEVGWVGAADQVAIFERKTVRTPDLDLLFDEVEDYLEPELYAAG